MRLRAVIRWKTWLGLVVLCLNPLWASAATPSVTLSLDRDTIVLGDSSTLTITIQPGNGSELPRLPDVPGIRYSNGTRGTRYEFINGRQRSYSDISYVLTPTQVGQFSIGPAVVRAGNQEVRGEPVTLTVVASDDPAASRGDGLDRAAFLHLALPSREVYVGETFVAEIWLNALPGSELRQAPQLQADGLVLGKLQTSTEQSSIRTNNRIYSRALFYLPMTAARAGNLPIQVRDCIVDVPLPQRRQFPSFFDAFGLGEKRRLNLGTPAIPLRVLPLPRENVPEIFTGAVGNFEVAITATPTNLRAGDPITVRVDIKGRGNFDSVQLADQPAWRGFRVYPPTANFATEDPLGLSGIKHFEQVVTPESAGLRELPPLQFAFFSPEARSYRVVETRAVPLQIAPSPNMPALPEPVVREQTAEPVTPEIAPLKPHLGTLAAQTIPWTAQRWFVLVGCAPWLAWAGVAGWRRVRQRSNSDLQARQRKLAEKRIHEGTAQLAQCSQKADSAEFFAVLFRTLQEIISLRINLPAASITEGVADVELPGRGVSPETIASVHRLFQACNQARYSRTTDPADLETLRSELEAIRRDLRDGS